MRFFISFFCLLLNVHEVFAATSNVVSEISIANHSSYPLKSENWYQFIMLTSPIEDSDDIFPYTLQLNMDPTHTPTDGKLVAIRPKGSKFKFGLAFITVKKSFELCLFQLTPIDHQDDISLIAKDEDAPVKCSFSIDDASHQPTILLENNK